MIHILTIYETTNQSWSISCHAAEATFTFHLWSCLGRQKARQGKPSRRLDGCRKQPRNVFRSFFSLGTMFINSCISYMYIISLCTWHHWFLGRYLSQPKALEKIVAGADRCAAVPSGGGFWRMERQRCSAGMSRSLQRTISYKGTCNGFMGIEWGYIDITYRYIDISIYSVVN